MWWPACWSTSALPVSWLFPIGIVMMLVFLAFLKTKGDKVS